MKFERAASSNDDSGFTLIELLVVVAVIVLMTSLAIPAFNAIRGGTDFTTEVYDIAGTLDQARSYAMANNTYVLAGIAEVSAALDSSASPQLSGTGRIAMAIVASKTGTRPYQSLITTNSLGNWQTSAYNTSAFLAVTKILVLPNLHLVDLQNSSSMPPQPGSTTPPPGMARPAVDMSYNLSSASGTSNTQFAWPLGTIPNASNAQYTFARVIEFDPQGCARVISSPSTYPDAVPGYIEIGLQPAHGTIAAGSPSSQSINPGQIAAIQINGISGANLTYRP